MLPSPSELKYFMEVADTLNISRASERLGITQPSLSMALRRLESTLGTGLLIRKKSGVRLTRAGQLLAQRARDLVSEWSSLRSDVLRTTRDISGKFSLGCYPSIGVYTLPSFLPALLTQYPNVAIDLEHDLSRRITEKVISHTLDFGIVVNPVSHPDLAIYPICNDKVTLWSCDGQIKDTILYHPDIAQTHFILNKLEKKGLRARRTLISPSFEIITTLACANAGMAILPARTALRTNPPLKLVLPDPPSYQDRVCLVFRPDSQKNAAAKVIIAAIKKMRL